MFRTGLGVGAYEPISFKLDMMIDMTKLYTFHSTTNDLDLHPKP